MKRLPIVEYHGERVLTTRQIADMYECEDCLIRRNFNRNPARYIAGKHYIYLCGDELKRFKTTGQIDSSSKRMSKLYLWTEKGALLPYNLLIDTLRATC